MLNQQNLWEVMISLAPAIAARSLEVGADKLENAYVTLEWAMALTKQYDETCEAIALTQKEAPAAGQPSTKHKAERIQPAQVGIPSGSPSLHDLR